MDLKTLSRRDRMIGVAILDALFALSLFLPWGSDDFRGWDRDSAVLMLIIAILAVIIYLGEAFDYEMPRLPVSAVGAVLTALTLFYTLISIIDVRDQSWGLVFALIVSVVATVLAVSIWAADRARGTAPPA